MSTVARIMLMALVASASAYVPAAAAPLNLARRSPAPAMLAHGQRVNALALQMLLARESEEPKKKVQTAEEPIRGAYQTDKPSEDPDETCFMTPSWMDEAGNKEQEWVCTKEPVRPDDSDDGF